MFAVPSEHACLPLAPAASIPAPVKTSRRGFAHPVTLRKAMVAAGSLGMSDPWSQKHAADRAKASKEAAERTDPRKDPAVQERIAARGKARQEANRPGRPFPYPPKFWQPGGR